MKVRLDFVTNSSSSSFICDVCGSDESGWDLCISDTDMLRCANGHTFCSGHASKQFDRNKPEHAILLLEGAVKRMKKTAERQKKEGKEVSSYYYKYIKEYEDAIKEIKENEDNIENHEDTLHDLESDEGVPTEFCPICTFESLSDEDALKYLMKKHNISSKKILTEIKTNYNEYSDFLKDLK
jgi:hypothetical protein